MIEMDHLIHTLRRLSALFRLRDRLDECFELKCLFVFVFVGCGNEGDDELLLCIELSSPGFTRILAGD